MGRIGRVLHKTFSASVAPVMLLVGRRRRAEFDIVGTAAMGTIDRNVFNSYA